MLGRRLFTRAVVAVALIAGLTVTGSPGTPAGAGPAERSAEKGRSGDVPRGARLSADAPRQAARSHFAHKGKLGELRAWPAYQEDGGGNPSYYLKDFRLRAVSPHVEVWLPEGDGVSRGLEYQSGDCRNTAAATTVTDAQIAYLVDQYESVVLPRETSVFGAADKRDGTKAWLPTQIPSLPSSAYRGPGDRLVLLVDNFRERSFWQPAPAAVLDGFVDDVQMNFVDRNVVNLRGTSWTSHLGPNPGPALSNPCGTWGNTEHLRIPSGVEATLAHEHVHVLQASAGDNAEALYNDPAWLSEGVAEWAVHLTGYRDPAVNDMRNFRIECFLGQAYFVPGNEASRCPGGAENSLTIFGEGGQAPAAEYGAAAAFMELLADRYGPAFMGELVTTVGVWGAAKVEALLAQRGNETSFDELVADFGAAMALDGVIDDGAALQGADASRFQVDGMDASVDWAWPYSYARPGPIGGVPPNGSDYVRLRDADGAWLDADAIDSLDLNGDTRLDCRWIVDPDAHGAGNGALYSGGFNNGQDRLVALPISVPASGGPLEFDTRFDTEQGWDFGYVQISTDGGATWTSLAATGTTSDHDPNAQASIVADLPGFTGHSDWTHSQADLGPWAGQDVLVGFRYRTDAGVADAGFWVDNVGVAGQLLSDGSSLDGWQQLPPPVHGLVARVISYTDDHSAASYAELPLDGDNDAHLTGDQLRSLVAPGAETVAVIVTHLQDDETLFCPVAYELRVNGVLQPGGAPTLG